MEEQHRIQDETYYHDQDHNAAAPEPREQAAREYRTLAAIDGSKRVALSWWCLGHLTVLGGYNTSPRG